MWWKRRGATGVRRLLMEGWDPIGVAEIPEAADEYDTYVGAVGRMLREGRSADEIHAYLTFVRVDRIGLGRLPGWEEREQIVADRLANWYADEMRGAGE